METFSHRGYVVRIMQDEDAESPRDWENATTFVLSHGRYSLPNEANIRFDEFGSWEEIAEHLRESYNVVALAQVFGYEHGALTISCAPYADRWDSGIAGLVYVTKEQQDEAGTPTELLQDLIRGEVETYDMYLRGDVYGYVVEDEAGNTIDSCWGFFGYEHCEAEAKEQAEWFANERDEAQATEDAMSLLPIVLNV